MNFSVDISVEEKGRRRPEYRLNTDLRGEITLQDLLEFTKSSLIITADEVLKDEQDRGFDREPVLVVDGRQGKPIQSVSPLGQIEFVARQNMKDILLEAYNALLYRSPVLTGRYKSSHFVFVNGKQVASDLNSLTLWLNSNPNFRQSDLIRIVNIQPYARKLERYGIRAGDGGNIGRRRTERSRDKRKAAQGHRILAPNGAYFLTARAIRAKYKRNSVIRFTFISGGSLGIRGNFKLGRKGKPGRPYLYPSIVISVQERGIA